MTERIFLSYAGNDRGNVGKLKDQLRQLGLVTSADVEILDPHKVLKVGDDIRSFIRDKMKTASKVVFIASPKAAQSDWVNYELGMASALDKPIFVVGSHAVATGEMFRSLGAADVRAINLEIMG